jgi:hypothetical protein
MNTSCLALPFSYRTYRWCLTLSLALLALPAAWGYYDPAAQRWVNRDPIGEKGGAHLYSFVQNGAVARTDPFGLQSSNARDWPGLNPYPPYKPNPGTSQGNCWRYACGDPGKPGEPHDTRPPGWQDKPSGSDPNGTKTCPEMMRELLKAGAKTPPCGAGYHRITVQYGDKITGPNGPQTDFHFSREFPDGSWGDKPGPSCSRQLVGPDDIPPGYVKCGELCVADGWDTDKFQRVPGP